MKKASKTLHLPPREKHCPASHMDIGLQRWCNDMSLKLVTNKAKIDVFRSKLRSKHNEWKMAA